MKKSITKAMVMSLLVFFAVSAKGQLPCATPAPLTVLELTPTTARVSLSTKGAGDNIGWYNVVVSTTPLADPRTAAGNNIVYSGLVPSGFSLSGLTANTKYYTYVQTNCDTENNYNGFSAWVRDSITTSCAAVTLPVTANFDEVAIPDCWSVAGGNKPVTNVIHYGTLGRSVRLQSTATADAFLISMPIAELANNLEISFKAYGVIGTQFRVGILENLADLSSLQDLFHYTISGNNVWTDYVAITPNFINAVSNAHVVFYIPAGSAQTVYIDNVEIKVKPVCPPPMGLEVSNITGSSATLKWIETDTATVWNVRYTTGDGVSQTVIAKTNPFTLSNLLFSTEYTVDISAKCGEIYSVPLNFTTVQNPATIPYSTGFESTDDVSWTLANGTQVNKWFIGSVPAAVKDGTKALYISSSKDGSTYQYDSISPAAPAPSVQSYVWAYRTLVLQQMSYTISFNWKANGEGSNDLLRAFLVPDSVVFTAGDAKKMTGNINTTPAGWIDIPTAGSGIGILNKKTDWQSLSVDIPIQNAGNYNLVFFWKNNTTGGAAPPAAIDNVSVIRTACKQPQNVTVKNITISQANVSWTPTGGETNWIIRVMNGENVVLSKLVTDNPTTVIPNLQPSTDYTVQLRAICAVGDTSTWTVSYKFKTVCRNSVPYTEIFDDYTQDVATSTTAPTTCPNNIKPQCWIFPYAGSTSTANPQAFLSSYTNYSAGTGKYFILKTANSIPAFGVLPEFNVPINNLVLSFDFRNYSTSYGDLYLGVMTNPMDTATFVSMASIPKAATPTPFKHDFSLDNLPVDANNIAFKFINTYSYNDYTMSLDNIIVEYKDCPRPLNVKVTQLKTTTAVLVFDGNASNYEVDLNGTVTTYQTNSIPLTGLSPGTKYTVKVRSACGSGKTSSWVSFTFKTMCNLYTVPYSFNFDEYSTDIATNTTTPSSFPNNTLPTCWIFPVLGADAMNGYPQVFLSSYASNSAGSGNYLNLKTDAVARPVYTVLPEFIVPIDSLTLSFRYRHSSADYGNLYIGVMTDPSDTATFKVLQSFPRTATATPVDVGFNYASFPDGARVIAFKYTSTSISYTMSIDEISVNKVSCLKPHFTLNNITPTSVDLFIDDDANTQWECSVVPRGSNPTATGNPIFTNKTPTISNLLPNTKYDVYLRVSCGTGWAGPVGFTTLCSTFPIPHYENFNGYSTDISNSNSAPATFPDNAKPTCWTFPVLGIKGSYPQVFFSTYTGHAVSGNCLLFKSSNAYPPLFAVLPEFSKPIDSLVISFTYRDEIVGASGTLQVGVMSNPADTSTFVLLETFPQIAKLTKVDHDFNYDDLPADAQHIAFKYIGGTSTSNAFSIDEISVTYPKCIRPQSISLDTVSNNSANISIVDDINNSWEFVIDTTGFSPSNVNVNIISSAIKTVNFPNLKSNTNYDVYARAVCSSNLRSDWRGPFTFKTECDEFDLPYVEDFEYGTNWATSPLGCWQMVGMSSDDVMTVNQKMHGNQSMVLTNVTAISPRLNVAQLGKCQVSGYTYTSADSARFTIGVMTNPSDNTTFEQVKEINISIKNQWMDFRIALDTLLTSDMAYVAASKYVVFTFPTSKPIYIDLLNIDTIHPCPVPGGIFINNVKDNQADVKWTAGGSETKWQVKVMQGTNVISSNIVTANPKTTVTGLVGNTKYTLQVRAICGVADTSSWTFAYNFVTACSVFPTPYYENFESYKEPAGLTNANITTANLNAPSAYPNNLLPGCWRFPSMNASSLDYPQAFFSSYAQYTAGAGNYLELRATNVTPAVAVLPEFNTAVDSLILSFTYRNYITGPNYGNLQIGVMTDPTDISTFVLLKTVPQVTVPTAFEYNFSNDPIPANARNVALRYLGSHSSAYYCFIDNIIVNKVTSCTKPQSFIINNVMAHSADIIVTDTAKHTTWEVSCVPLDAAPTPNGNFIITSRNSTVSNLSSATKYDVYLRTVCGTEKSAWIGPVKITTACVEFPLPYYESFDDYSGADVMTSGTAPTTFPNNLLPNCWSFPVKGATNTSYPQAFLSTYSAAAGKCLLFRSGSTYPSMYAILPEFNKPINNLRLAFTYKAENATSSGTLQFGVMTNPTDMSTFTLLQSLPIITTQTDVEHYFFRDNLPAGAKNIAFRYVGGTSSLYTLSLDNVSVVDITSYCEKPQSFEVRNVTTNSMDIVVTDSVHSAWEAVLVVPGAKPDTAKNIISLTDKTTTIPNLQLTKRYSVYVRANCGEGKSVWIGPKIMQTMCAPMSVPYNEYFNNYTGTDVVTSSTEPATYPNHLLPSCWSFIMSTIKGVSPEAFLSSYNLYSVNKGKYLLLKSSIKTPMYAVLPEFNEPLDSLVLRFSYKNDGITATSGVLQVGVMTDPMDTTSFILLEALPRISTATRVECSFNYSSLPAGIRHIAFKYVGGITENAYLGLDSISVTKETCFKPHFKVNNPALNSVDIIIDDNKNSQWECSIVPYGGQPTESNNTFLTNINSTVSGLIPSTVYYAYLRAVCGTNKTAWTGPVRFTTECALMPLPYEQKFDTYTASQEVSTTITTPLAYPNNLMAVCWTFPGMNKDKNKYPQAYLCNYSNMASGTVNYLLLTTNSSPAFAVLPEFNVPMDSLVLSFNYRTYNTSIIYGTLQVGVMTDPTDTTTFILVKSLPSTSSSAASSAEIEFNYSSLPADATNIAFRYICQNTAYYVSIDNVSVKKASCPTTHFKINNVHQTTAEIVIDDKANTQWEYSIVPAGNAASNSNAITDKTALISGLQPSTDYDVYLRVVCGSGGVSVWVGPVRFKTACANLLSLPYSENFDTYSGAANISTTPTAPTAFPFNLMPSCWTFHNQSTTYPQAFLSTYAGYPVSNNCLFLKSSVSTPLYAVLPEFDKPLDSLVLSFIYRNGSNTSADGTLQVGLMSDPSNPSTFVLIKAMPKVATLTAVKMGLYFNNFPVGMRNIAFRYVGGTSDNSYASIDEVLVEYTNCLLPHFTLNNISQNSVDLVIDDNANTSWEYSIVPVGSAPSETDFISIAENNYTISGLESSKSYDVYLRANCGVTTSDWVGPSKFITKQTIAKMPYIYSFEDVLENEQWILANGDGASAQVNKWFIANSEGAVKSGNNALYISNSPTGSINNYSPVISYVYAYRTFDLKDTIYNISFNWKAQGDGDWDMLRAFLVPVSVQLNAGNANGMTASTNTTPADWIDVTTGSTAIGILNKHTDWQTLNKDITITKAGLYNLVFFWKNYTSPNQPPAAVDDIIFRKKTCIKNVNIFDTINSSIPYYMENGFKVSTDTLHAGVNTLSRSELSTVDGICDTKYNLQLNIVPPVQNIVSDVHCGSVPYTNHDFNIPMPETRTYKRIMYDVTAHGADSTIILNLTVQDLQPTEIDTTVCDSKGYYFKGDTIKVSGAYVDTLKSIYGCDSIINLNLTVLPTRDTMQVTLCSNDSIFFNNAFRKITGFYEQTGLLNVLGCDSTSVLDLTMRAKIVTDLYEAICQGDTLNKYGWTNLTTPGYFTVKKTSIFGCDSTINLTLDVNRKDTIPDFISVAVDSLPYDYHGFMIDNLSVGTYQYFVIVGSNIYHCDSTVNLTVKVTPPSGFDNLYANSIKMYPNPIKVGSEVTIDCNIPESDRQDIVGEVFNVIGEKIYSVSPNVYPIKVKAFDASGIYVVRIRGAKLHYEGKIVVKE